MDKNLRDALLNLSQEGTQARQYTSEWRMKGGAGGRSKVTGGTYQERRYVPERDAFDVVTRDGLTGAVISTVEEPMKQLHVVKPSTPRVQMAGAEVLDYSDSYMVEGHNPGLLLARYRDVVGNRRKVDTLVGMGISGTVGVVNLARDLGIDYLILRKDGVSSHSSWPAEGRLGRNWLFVDDLVSSGSTFAKVWDKMQNIQKDTGFTSTFRGMFLYASPRGRFVSNRYDKEQFHWWLDGRAEHYQNEFQSKRSPAW